MDTKKLIKDMVTKGLKKAKIDGQIEELKSIEAIMRKHIAIQEHDGIEKECDNILEKIKELKKLKEELTND